MRSFDPDVIPYNEIHRLLVGGVAPRPIALVSTLDKEGRSNLSPFSFFNVFGVNPAVLCFSPSYSGKTGNPKHTMLNLLETKECTVSIVTFEMVHQISLASAPYERGVDEFIKSGDYYDFSTLWDGSPMIAIGDVSGKGISASLYMAETKGVVQALAPVMASMAELLEGTNGALLHNSPSLTSLRRSFVTLGLVSLGKKGVRYARAGHTPLLHVRADGTYRFLQPLGMAVGLIRQPIFVEAQEEISIEVQPGDVLVLFSDGITDARNAEGQEVGYDRLAEYVRDNLDVHNARDLTLKMLASVAEFTNSGNFDDDATLVVMRCL